MSQNDMSQNGSAKHLEGTGELPTFEDWNHEHVVLEITMEKVYVNIRQLQRKLITSDNLSRTDIEVAELEMSLLLPNLLKLLDRHREIAIEHEKDRERLAKILQVSGRRKPAHFKTFAEWADGGFDLIRAYWEHGYEEWAIINARYIAATEGTDGQKTEWVNMPYDPEDERSFASRHSKCSVHACCRGEYKGPKTELVSTPHDPEDTEKETAEGPKELP
ncbi:hypothetical protein K504DRAFT_451762 [Pleomassaria siparia CBS 279.74]|uniref:Uncharacterized protein n=1 Tax=Pleomassaria siparia CBS 279.74 TaxID=1314801 RepID=A0A6G1JRW9_9PLEO|nr:hypothetical protein K504DRAFT_451762 [Pleomassaria siparia CBS 279.74]